MLVNTKEILLEAKRKNYAIPAVNFIDLDSARVFVQTAEKEQKPLILAYAQAHEKVLSLEEAALMGRYLAEKVSVPIALHLDHGTDLPFIKKAIDLGFPSVMIDASTESFEQNVQRTREVVTYAHQRNVTVEAEIGHVGSGINYENHNQTDSIYTDVTSATLFVEKTGVDSLAVSIGTAHGIYKGTPQIDFNRLDDLQAALSIPLVLHGGSGSGRENLQRCGRNGINKINIFTDFVSAALKSIQKNNPTDYIQLKEIANESMGDVLKDYFQLAGTKKIGG